MENAETQVEQKNSSLKNGDFKKYYDTTQKRNYWILGYFGGGSVSVVDAYLLGKEYSEETNVPLQTVRIDEISSSRRFKRFKFIFSTEVQTKEVDAEEMENVYQWLTD